VSDRDHPDPINIVYSWVINIDMEPGYANIKVPLGERREDIVSTRENSAQQATRLHHHIRDAVRTERGAMHTIAHGLARMKETTLYKELGYAGLYEYAEAEFGFAPCKTQQLAQVGLRLRELPRLDKAFALGALGWTKVRTVAGVATPKTEEEWLLAATEKSSRELEEMASKCIRGETPPEKDEDEIENQEYVWSTLRWEPHNYDQLMRACVKLRARFDNPELSLSQLLLMLAERELERGDEEDVVASPRGENAYKEQYRIIEHRCPECERAWTEGRGGKRTLMRETRELVECDCEVVHGDADHEKAGHVSRTIPPAVRRSVLVRDEGQCQVPGCRHQRHLDLHHIRHRSKGGGHVPDNLVTVCSAHHDLLHRDVLRVTKNQDGTLTWKNGSGEPLALILKMGIDRAEIDHSYLSEFDGEPGEWCMLDEEQRERAHVCASRQVYPKGWQVFVTGDDRSPGSRFDFGSLPSR